MKRFYFYDTLNNVHLEFHLKDIECAQIMSSYLKMEVSAYSFTLPNGDSGLRQITKFDAPILLIDIEEMDNIIFSSL